MHSKQKSGRKFIIKYKKLIFCFSLLNQVHCLNVFSTACPAEQCLCFERENITPQGVKVLLKSIRDVKFWNLVPVPVLRRCLTSSLAATSFSKFSFYCIYKGFCVVFSFLSPNGPSYLILNSTGGFSLVAVFAVSQHCCRVMSLF